MGLTVCTLLAFFVQWALLLPSTIRFLRTFLSLDEMRRMRLFTPEFRALFRSISVTMIGLGAIQINGLLDSIFARIASLEGPAFMYYATRLYQLPVSLIGISLSSAILPSLARALEKREHDHFKRLLTTALRRAASLALPVMFGLLVMSDSLISLIFYRGNFTAASVLNSTECLWGLSLGLVPATFSLLLAQPFYALKNYRTPTLASLYSVALNVVLNIIFTLYFHWGASSTALATSLATTFGAVYLGIELKKHIPLKEIFSPLMKVCFRLSARGPRCRRRRPILLYLHGDAPLFPAVEIPRQLMDQAIQISTLGVVFLGALVLFARLFKASEILHFLRLKK